MFFRKNRLTSSCPHCCLFVFLSSSFEGTESTGKELVLHLNGPKKLSKTNIKGFSVFLTSGLNFCGNSLGLPNLGNPMKCVQFKNPFVNLEQQRMKL